MDKRHLILGIDIGTTKVASLLAEPGGRVLAVESRPHHAQLSSPPRFAHQDVSMLLARAQQAVLKLPATLRDRVRAIGVTGQMHGVALLDSSGRPVSPLITWQDARCSQEFLLEVQRKTGHALRSGYGCATLAWLAANRPKLFAGRHPAARGATVADIAVMTLCGLDEPVTDPTNAASWGFFDQGKQEWDLAPVRKGAIPRTLLPRIVLSGTRAGRLCAEAAERLGLPAGIPVCAAIGDNHASLLATVQDPRRELALTIGTGAQLSAVASNAFARGLKQDKPFELRPFTAGRSIVVAASLCGGSAWQWLAGSTQSMIKDSGAHAPSLERIFARMNKLGLAAARRSAPDALVILPNFLGERHDPALRGAIGGIDLHNFTLGPLAWALACGIIRNLSDMLPPQVHRGKTAVVGSGNALRQNPLLQLAVREVLGMHLTMSGRAEEAALGAAINAAGLAD